ncbi:hypothetical protein A2419_00280 [Candidatus Adlerbacteria bacterium RIFOXYC1_FULL_48_26]|uniref:Uncharacterized protein n=1 Tax=Candidatus Adlerbacteria bacterium RIFOXYC1_FULL_48_26 TaxID=1797247 RepID=A0A1F4Y253_9BACT|nr:MAG: hypothetical protein A2419_00280 [Candidatus Adlerbacteria bacterium RIFOXYC1_FULL_48_26]OGC94552.1 MAG: hypothetical protein A2389_01900 [Candidatus Adlerbacteria bacterium RIFOXYB1_FULL_48_10]
MFGIFQGNPRDWSWGGDSSEPRDIGAGLIFALLGWGIAFLVSAILWHFLGWVSLRGFCIDGGVLCILCAVGCAFLKRRWFSITIG